MKTVFHGASTRGQASHGGWLTSAHSFSFAQYYHPERMGFGALRVLNDDQVAGGGGFPPHGHQNMEIISIPLQGALAHQDNMGNKHTICQGDVQIMSAGTGVMHSEFNVSATEDVCFLQIWIIPDRQNVAPRYDQQNFAKSYRQNTWQALVVPFEDALLTAETGTETVSPLPIYQQAYFSRVQLTAGKTLDYSLHDPGHGVYFFVLSGSVDIAGQALGVRDALGVVEAERIALQANAESEVLAIEVPML